MKKLLASLAVASLVVACLTAAQKSALTAEGIALGEQTAACVTSAAVGGQTSASAIALSCGISDAPTVLQIVQTLIAGLSAPHDGGLGAGLADGDRARILVALRSVK